nr:DUF3333 domain-containing protein [Kaustia mangrovi]
MTSTVNDTGRSFAYGQAALIERSLKRRHAKERRFRLMGMLAVIAAIGFVVVLFSSVLARGLPAFWQATITLDVTFDPEVVDVGPPPSSRRASRRPPSRRR